MVSVDRMRGGGGRTVAPVRGAGAWVAGVNSRVWRVQLHNGAEATYYSAWAMSPEAMELHIPDIFMGHDVARFRPLAGGEWRECNGSKTEPAAAEEVGESVPDRRRHDEASSGSQIPSIRHQHD